MKKLTIMDLATILQIDEDLKEELRQNWDKYDEALKYDLLDIFWRSLHELKERLAMLKYEKYMAEVEQGKRKIMSSMHSEAIKEVWQDFDDILSGKTKDEEILKKIRDQLQPLVSSSPKNL